jgi:formylglycine-generating enzyme required for sulfatase activity
MTCDWRFVVAVLAVSAGCWGGQPKQSAPAQEVQAGEPAVPRFRVDCDAKHAPRPERDPTPMCWVPAGTMLMGAPAHADAPGDGPERHVTISRGFYLDQYPVTRARFGDFVRAQQNRCPSGPNGACAVDSGAGVDITPGSGFPTDPRFAHLPPHVRHELAVEYCEWAGKQLPTEAEWELAARRDPATGAVHTYVWGDDPKPDAESKHGVSAVGVHNLGTDNREAVRDCYLERTACVPPCVDPIATTCPEHFFSTSRPPFRAVTHVDRGGWGYPAKTRVRGLRSTWSFRCMYRK